MFATVASKTVARVVTDNVEHVIPPLVVTLVAVIPPLDVTPVVVIPPAVRLDEMEADPDTVNLVDVPPVSDPIVIVDDTLAVVAVIEFAVRPDETETDPDTVNTVTDPPFPIVIDSVTDANLVVNEISVRF